MQKITVGFIYEVVPVFSRIGAQEMDVQQAAFVAQAIEAVTKHLNDLEPRRQALVAQEYEGESAKEKEAKREAAFKEFSKEEVEIPDLNFKNLPGIRLTPNDILLLKGAGLYTEALEG